MMEDTKDRQVPTTFESWVSNLFDSYLDIASPFRRLMHDMEYFQRYKYMLKGLIL